MILVDTSVLINYLKGTESLASQRLEAVINQGIPWGINEFIYQELLQGARNLAEFETLKEYLEPLVIHSLPSGTTSFEQAARMNVLCRQSGITVRSTIDLLIAQTAIEHQLFLLHNDQDF